MVLKEIFSDQFIICAVTNRGDCAFETELFNLIEDEYRASRINLVKQLEALARQGFSSEQYTSRRVNKPFDIWELKDNKLRAIYFKGVHPNIIICTDLHVKQQQKVDQKAVDKAIAYKKSYLAAKQSNQLNIIKDDENADE